MVDPAAGTLQSLYWPPSSNGMDLFQITTQSMGQLPICIRPAGTGKLNKPLPAWEVFTQHNKQVGWQLQHSALWLSALQKENHPQHHTGKLSYRKMEEKAWIIAGQRAHVWTLAFRQDKFRRLQNTSQDRCLGPKLSTHQQKTKPHLAPSPAFGGGDSSDVRTWEKPAS